MWVLLLIAVALWAFLRERGSASVFATGSSETQDFIPQASPSLAPAANSDSAAGQLDNLAQAIATLEGFGIPVARPTRDNNPGDVKSGPGMIGRDAPGSAGIAQFADVGDGWDALNGWITSHVSAHPDWDFYDLTHYYATGDTQGQPAQGEADPDKSAEAIAGFLGVDPTTLVSSVLEG